MFLSLLRLARPLTPIPSLWPWSMFPVLLLEQTPPGSKLLTTLVSGWGAKDSGAPSLISNKPELARFLKHWKHPSVYVFAFW